MDYICFDAGVDAKETDVANVPYQPNPRSQTLALKRTGGEGVDVSKAILFIIPIAFIGIVASFAIYAYTMLASYFGLQKILLFVSFLNSSKRKFILSTSFFTLDICLKSVFSLMSMRSGVLVVSWQELDS